MNLSMIFLIVAIGFGLISIFRPNMPIGKAGSHATRLERIRMASLLVQFFLCLIFLLAAYWILAFLCGWPFEGEPHVRIVISHNHIYTSPKDMPANVFIFWLLKTGVGFASCVALFALFRLYYQGILFSAKNIRLIQFLGLALVIGSAVDYQMQSAVRDVDWSSTPVLIGMLINFIAMIMDEGWKIQEEQELTV
jgi:hypothetical protein